MRILGLSAYYHDSAAALIQDGDILAAAQKERFSRKKHDARFPVNAIRYCPEHAKVSLDDIDHVVFYDKPFLRFERLIETYTAFSPTHLNNITGRQYCYVKATFKHGEIPGGKLSLSLTNSRT